VIGNLLYGRGVSDGIVSLIGFLLMIKALQENCVKYNSFDLIFETDRHSGSNIVRSLLE